MPRLPIPGSDDGSWGDILNEYIEVVHGADGTLKANVVGTANITNNAITSDKIANGTIVNADISTTAAVEQNKIANLISDLASKTDKSTLTTKGDIYAATAASTPARLPAGSDNQVLTADSSEATGLRWSTAATGDMTLAGDQTVTGAKTFDTGALLDNGNKVYNVKAFGALGDGSTNDTASVQNAVNACLATGGTVFFPAGHYILQPGLISPNYDEVTVARMKPLRLVGAGADWRTTIGSNSAPEGGTILDFQGTALGSGVGCIEVFGTGLLEIESLFFTQTGTAHTIPYIYTTNTTLMVRNNCFSGHPTKSGGGANACNQDAIVMGGTTNPGGSPGIYSTPESGFQGYGTVIQNNWFNRIRRGVWGRRWANGVVIRDNTWWNACGSDGGSASASGAAIEFYGGESGDNTVGVTVISNLIEMPGYYYGIRMGSGTVSNSIITNNFYDPGVNTTAYVNIPTGSSRHLIIAGFHSDLHAFVDGDGAASCTVINHHQAQISTFGGGPLNLAYVGSPGNEGLRVTGNASFAGGAFRTRIQPATDQVEGAVLFQIARSASDDVNPGGEILRISQNASTQFTNESGQRVDHPFGGRWWRTLDDHGELHIRTQSHNVTVRSAALQHQRGSDGTLLSEFRTAPHDADRGAIRFNGSTFITTGTGSPEGIVTAPVGSMFMRTDGGAGTTLYIKESGAGSTGWVAK